MIGALPAATPPRDAAEVEDQCPLAERVHGDAALGARNAWRRLGRAIALPTAASTGSAMAVVGPIPGFGGEGRTAPTGRLALPVALCTAAFAFPDLDGRRDRRDPVGRRLSGLRTRPGRAAPKG